MRLPEAGTLISLRKSVTELDRLENLLKGTAECYKNAIRCVSKYAIELNAHELTEFRDHLHGIEERFGSAANSEDLRSVQASFRGELRDYRDQVRGRLTHLFQELEASAAAMATFASGVSASSDNHQERLKREMDRLALTAKSEDLEKIRQGIARALGEVAAGLEEIRRGNQMLVAQMQDEIKLLHREMQAERRTLYTDPASGAWNRQKVDLRIEELLRQGDSFCLLLIVVNNFAAISRRYSRTVVEGMFKALIRRLRNLVGPDALIGRWSEHEFVAFLNVELAGAITLSRNVAKGLSGNYSMQENGLAHEVDLQVATVVVDRGAGSDADAFRKRIAQLTLAVRT